jgi:hypothetical protein
MSFATVILKMTESLYPRIFLCPLATICYKFALAMQTSCVCWTSPYFPPKSMASSASRPTLISHWFVILPGTSPR